MFETCGDVEVSVKDTGAGMSEDQLAKLVSDGVQFNVNKLQAGQGSGLGLYIAKGIVDQHSGTLTAASDGLGKGTTFKLTLPLYHVPAAIPENESIVDAEELAANIKRNNDANATSNVESSVMKVLVVDDAALNRKLLTRLVSSGGHLCDEACDGSDAVARVEAKLKDGDRYDTILLDFEMPVMNGPTAARHIRDLGCDSFIVGITGNVLPEDIAHFKANGANAVLPKPFHMTDLEELWVEYVYRGDAKLKART